MWGNTKHVHHTRTMKPLIREKNFQFSVKIYHSQDRSVDRDQDKKYWNYRCSLISNICFWILTINISGSSLFINLNLANKRWVCSSSLPLYSINFLEYFYTQFNLSCSWFIEYTCLFRKLAVLDLIGLATLLPLLLLLINDLLYIDDILANHSPLVNETHPLVYKSPWKIISAHQNFMKDWLFNLLISLEDAQLNWDFIW